MPSFFNYIVTYAYFYYFRINLLCIISTHPANFRLKVMNIVNTWAKRCDNVVFTTPSYSDKPEDKGFWENVIKDPKIKVLEVNGTSSRKDLWVRLKDGFIK